MRLRKLLGQYQVVRKVSPKTMEHRLGIISVFENDTKIVDTDLITHDVLLKWRETIVERASPATWDNYFKGLRTLWNFGMQEGYFENNPFARIKREIPKSMPKLVDHRLISEAIEYLVGDEEPIKPGWFWSLVIRTFYYTGMRRNQLVNLRWCDLESDYSSCILLASHIQGREDHAIVIDPEISANLAELYDITSRTLGRNPRPEEQVFNVTYFHDRYSGRTMTTNHIAGVFRRLSDALGTKITPHRLRDTMAVTLFEETGHLANVSHVLGHRDGRTALRYVRPDLRAQQSVVGILPRV